LRSPRPPRLGAGGGGGWGRSRNERMSRAPSLAASHRRIALTPPSAERAQKGESQAGVTDRERRSREAAKRARSDGLARPVACEPRARSARGDATVARQACAGARSSRQRCRKREGKGGAYPKACGASCGLLRPCRHALKTHARPPPAWAPWWGGEGGCVLRPCLYAAEPVPPPPPIVLIIEG
jgi:hypothetical protein